MKINLSKDVSYYTQRNNRFYPYGTCNTTSMIQALEASGIPFDYPEGVQPEDHLTQILDTKEAWDIMKARHPWAVPGGFAPRHVHAMLDWAVNEKLVGQKIVEFRTNVSIKEILLSILRFHAVVVGGRFTKYGHIVSVVGFDTTQKNLTPESSAEEINLEQVSHIIIDDPYGNFHTGYKDVNGNDTLYTVQQFDWVVKNYNNPNKKWAHIFGGVL